MTEAEELADMKLLSRIYRTTAGRTGFGLIIMPTYECNFCCSYCYQQHRIKHGRDWIEHTMSDEMIDAIFSALGNYKARGYAVDRFTFYGGEPFLKKNLPVVRKIAERGRAAGMEMNAITNGYDLEAYLDFLEEFKFTYLQVTIDGVGEVHNRRRIHKSGADTYEQIFSNVERVLERGIGIDLRINIGTDNLYGIKDLIEDFRARGLIDKENARQEEERRLKKFNPKAKTARGKFYYYLKTTDNEEHPERNVSERSTVEELFKAGLSVEEAFGHQNRYCSVAEKLFAMSKKDSFPSFDPTFCGAESGMIVIDPFGRLYSCYDFVNNKEMEIGFVDVKRGRFVMNFELAKWKTRTADLLKNCPTCPYCFICSGGCAARARFTYGDWRQEICGENKEVFNFAASTLAGMYWQKTHAEEISLSLSGPLSRLSPKEREIFTTSNSQKEIFDLARKTDILPQFEEG